jgi:hypothetical protein
MYANISLEHTASIIRSEVSSVKKWILNTWLGERSDQEGLANRNHGMRRGELIKKVMGRHVVCMGDMRNEYNILVRNPKWKRELLKYRCRLQY